MDKDLWRLTRRDWGWALAVVLFAVVLNLNTLPGHFFMDDLTIVRDNPLVVSPDLKTIFSTDYWSAKPLNSGLYRPLTIYSFALNRTLTGAAPWGFHLVNILFYGLVAGLAFLAIRTLRQPVVPALAAAALFAAHPMHAEVINQLVGRSELLVAAFLLLGLVLAQQESRGYLLWVPGLYLMALFSKEHAIVFPALLLTIDLFFCTDLRRLWTRRRGLYGLLFLATVGWLLLRRYAVDHAGLSPMVYSPYYEPQAFVSTFTRVLSAFADQGRYLGKLLLPFGLQGAYSGPNDFIKVEKLLSVSGVAIVLGGTLYLTGISYGWRRRHPVALAAILYGVCFFPVSNLLFVVSLFADRLAFFPSLWFCMGLVSLLFELSRGRIISRVFVGGLIVLFSVLTPLRNQIYREPITLWQQDVSRDANNPLARLFLAAALGRADRTEEALTQYRQLQQRYPDFLDPLHDFANFLLRHHYSAEALEVSRDALRRTPGRYQPTELVLAGAYQQLGQARESLKVLSRLGEEMHVYGQYWDIRGRALESLGRIAEAISSYRQVHDLPNDSDTLAHLGKLLVGTGQSSEAVRVLRLDAEQRDLASSWNALGVALAMDGDVAQAVDAFRKATKGAPQNRHYRENLERARQAVTE